MKPFNVEAALAGAPVQLLNGSKAYVFFNINNVGEDVKYPLVGLINGRHSVDSWQIDGSYIRENYESSFDIIGMWEEPELTSVQVLEKAYQKNLPITNSEVEGVFTIIGKTKSGEYILAYPGETMRHHIVSEDSEGWRLYVEPKQPEPETITVTLPKPFKPRQGDEYWFIYTENNVLCVIKANRFFNSDKFTPDGNYFRTESDAQAWLDAMKGALDVE